MIPYSCAGERNDGNVSISIVESALCCCSTLTAQELRSQRGGLVSRSLSVSPTATSPPMLFLFSPAIALVGFSLLLLFVFAHSAPLVVFLSVAAVFFVCVSTWCYCLVAKRFVVVN